MNPKIAWRGVRSSNIHSVKHDPATNTLHVKFHDGAVYEYEGVPGHLYEGLLNAPSVGRFHHQNIKQFGGYRIN